MFPAVCVVFNSCLIFCYCACFLRKFFFIVDLRFYIFFYRWMLFFCGSGRSRALLAVSWLGGLFYGGMVSFMPLFTRFVRGFRWFPSLSIILLLSGGAGFAFVVCGGFCALSSFWRWFVFFNISALIVAFRVIFRRSCGFQRFFCALCALLAFFRIVWWHLSVFLTFLFVVGLCFFAPIFLHC